MKTKIDIEKLLQWAMRDELPKGQAVAASSWDIITQYAALGVRVDVSRSGEGFGFVAGEPSDDALIVADAIKALDTSARFADVEDVLPLFGDFAGIAGDAARAIASATFNVQAIVISNAALGKRPCWDFDHPTPLQMFAPTLNGAPRSIVYGKDRDGDLVEVRPGADGRYRLKTTPRSPINWHNPSPLQVGECRAEYVMWLAALRRLADDLDGKLDAFDVYPSDTPMFPWLTGVPARRVLAGRDLSAGDIDPGLAPRRHRPVGKPVESPIEAETVASYNRASRKKVQRSAAI